MEKKALFQEKQVFSRLIIYGVFIFLMIFPVIQLWKFVFGNQKFHSTGELIVFIFSLLIPTLVFLFFLIMNLMTEITSDMIRIKFYPLHKNFVEYKISEISRIDIVTYKPLSEYGGWGIRGFGQNKAFNVKGNKGLKLYFKNGNIRMIGTQKPEELKTVIQEINLEN